MASEETPMPQSFAAAHGRKWAEYFIENLGLKKHPEGGYYREMYRSEITVAKNALPERFEGNRSASTAIYFLIDGENFSAFHRIRSDEIWHFYAGVSLELHVIDPQGRYKMTTLGLDLDRGMRPQFVVMAGCWFAARLCDQTEFSLVGCTVAPGFEFKDFELAKRAELIALCPEQREVIEQLTRE